MALNIKNILRVADAIENASIPDLGFNMCTYLDCSAYPDEDKLGRGCGTTACIAGWAAGVAVGGIPPNNRDIIAASAAAFLGLSLEERKELFLMTKVQVSRSSRFQSGIHMDDVTPAQAVQCLRNLAETGKVDWEAVL